MRCSLIRVLAVCPPFAFWNNIVESTTPFDFLFLMICGCFFPVVTLQKTASPFFILVFGNVRPSVSKFCVISPYVSCFLNSEPGAWRVEAFDFAYVLYVVDRPRPLSIALLLNKSAVPSLAVLGSYLPTSCKVPSWTTSSRKNRTREAPGRRSRQRWF